ncbi:ribonuclease J [Candidatus Microgenomates bacterium]|nr:ribonuclease J [Candidatus Microgenomates bacterium]
MDMLKFIAVSGTTGVTENLYIYEYGSDIIVVDCGVGFPEEATYGVDLVIPDFSYLVQNKNKIRGVFISHGHEDHYGALPFLLRELSVPVYTAKLTAGFIEDKLADYKVRGTRIVIIDPDKGAVKLGNFTVEAFRVTHSVPDALGFCITTPVGKLFHVSDYKFDWTPVDQRPFDIARAARLAQGETIALASDSLGSTSQGYTHSELEIEKTIELIVDKVEKKVFFTTISSNISRMRQALNASRTFGRKVVFVGRSIETKMGIAKKLGLVSWEDGLVISRQEAQKLPPHEVTYIISGCYGQIDSALYKVALDEHQFLTVNEGDVVIFSADPSPPGTEQAVNYIVDKLIEHGANVHYYDTQEDLHVSGHGSQKDIEVLFSLIRARYLIPIGGTIRHMREYTKLAQTMGWDGHNVFELRGGDSIEFTREGARRGKPIPSQSILVDGLGVGDVGNVVLRDRKTLAREGIVIVVIQLDRSTGMLTETPELISRGFVFAREQQKLLNEAGRALLGEIQKRHKKGDGHLARETTIKFLERFFFEKTARRPMILPVVVEV